MKLSLKSLQIKNEPTNQGSPFFDFWISSKYDDYHTSISDVNLDSLIRMDFFTSPNHEARRTTVLTNLPLIDLLIDGAGREEPPGVAPPIIQVWGPYNPYKWPKRNKFP